MSSEKTSRRIAWEAAKLLQSGSEKSLLEARRSAARRLYRGRIPFDRLPDEAAIRSALLALSSPHPAAPLSANNSAPEDADRFADFRVLLRQLETVIQPRDRHPEGDALYHVLQVFDLVRQDAPYDEELLLAALLHDVGKVVDVKDPISNSLDLLGDQISERTKWLIENHRALRAQYDGSISARRRRALRSHPWYEDLVILAEADRDGRQVGVAVPNEDEALQYIAELAGAF